MWYSSGTVSVTSGGTAVTGSGTAFLANVRIGDGITIQGSTSLHEVIGIASDTSLTIRPAYAGTTGSGRQYATVPVLGYDKDLSDAFNDIRLNFGSTLSALQPWAYAATAEAARTELGLGTASQRDMPPGVNELGTIVGLDVPAGVNELGTIIGLDVPPGVEEVYHRLNAVGTVSESGGVPTGALVQYGSNENGEFWRYAGGMQICAALRNLGSGAASTQIGSLFAGFSDRLSFAAEFISAPKIILSGRNTSSSIVDVYSCLAFPMATVTASSYFPVVLSPRSLLNGQRGFYEISIGRWHT